MGKAASWCGAEMVRYTILLKNCNLCLSKLFKMSSVGIFSTIGGNLLQSRVWPVQDQGISRFCALQKSISSTAIGVFSVCFHFYITHTYRHTYIYTYTHKHATHTYVERGGDSLCAGQSAPLHVPPCLALDYDFHADSKEDTNIQTGATALVLS